MVHKVTPVKISKAYLIEHGGIVGFFCFGIPQLMDLQRGRVLLYNIYHEWYITKL